MIPKEVLGQINKVLKDNIDDFTNIKTQEDEMNIDTHLKSRTLKIIKNNMAKINQVLPSNISIINVKTNAAYFNLKKQQTSVSRLADLVILLNINNQELHYEIEIKKTNNNAIPGSSINQIDPYKTIVFFKFKKEVEVIVGYYSQAVSGTIRFPDRMPRPEVSFSVLQTNVEEDLSIEKTIESNQDVFENPVEVFLPERWLKELFSHIKKNNWFSKAIRHFSYQLLKKYDTMTPKEKKELLEHLKEKD